MLFRDSSFSELELYCGRAHFVLSVCRVVELSAGSNDNSLSRAKPLRAQSLESGGSS